MDGWRAGISFFFSTLPVRRIRLSIPPPLPPLSGSWCWQWRPPPPGATSIYQRRVIETCVPSLSAKRLADCLHFHSEGCDSGGGGGGAAPIAINWDPSHNPHRHPPRPTPTSPPSSPHCTFSEVFSHFPTMLIFLGCSMFFFFLSIFPPVLHTRRSAPFPHPPQPLPPPVPHLRTRSRGKKVKEADGTQTVVDPIRAPPGALSEYRRISIKHPPSPFRPSFLPPSSWSL